MNKLEIKQGSFIQQIQYFIPDSRSGGNQCFLDRTDFYRICPSDRHVWESLWTCLVKVIPETCCTYLIRYTMYRYTSSLPCLIHVWNSRLQTKIFVSWTKATLLRIYFCTLSVQRSCLQYKSQCLEKVNVKYVINRLWHEIFHIVPGNIPPTSLSGLIWESQADYL